jgi:hypothetical protein
MYVFFSRVAIIMSLAVFFKARLKIEECFCGVAATEFYSVYSIVADATKLFVFAFRAINYTAKFS